MNAKFCEPNYSNNAAQKLVLLHYCVIQARWDECWWIYWKRRIGQDCHLGSTRTSFHCFQWKNLIALFNTIFIRGRWMQFVITCITVAELHFAGFKAFAHRAKLASRSRCYDEAFHGKPSSDNLSREGSIWSELARGMQFKEAGAVVAINMPLHLHPSSSNSGVDTVKRGTWWGWTVLLRKFYCICKSCRAIFAHQKIERTR